MKFLFIVICLWIIEIVGSSWMNGIFGKTYKNNHEFLEELYKYNKNDKHYEHLYAGVLKELNLVAPDEDILT